MNKLITALALLIFSIQFSKCEETSLKTAILMVHFGTTFDDTRALTIDAINHKASETFPDYTVIEAYTSRIVMNRLKKRGVVKPTPREALLRLAADGYERVIVQSTNVIDGVEAESLRDEVEYMTPFFKDIRIGRPLLYSTEDCEKVAAILAGRYNDILKVKKSAVVLVGHGTETPATAIYSQMDYIFKASGNSSMLVSTIEGYPTFDTTLKSLISAKFKEVTLVPFMFVAGDHARNDIAGEWTEALTESGFKVESVMEGLGQIPEIQDIYINHIRQALADKPLSASQRKQAFILENL